VAGQIESSNFSLILSHVEIQANLQFNKILRDVKEGKYTLQEAKRKWGVA
jgi:hypothetical protein